MRVIYGLRPFPRSLKRPVATLGSFDGVHRGHRQILRQIIARSRRKRTTSLLITFDPHPVKILRPTQFMPLLTCLPHRLNLLAQTGLDACRVIPFTRAFSRVTAEAFVKRILVERAGISEIWVGFDVAFGRDRKGTFSLLQSLGDRHGFKVFQIPNVCIGRERISSSRVRRFVEKGNLSKAAQFLGRPFSLHGKVVSGSGRGRILGSPTANLKLCEQILPPLGVYAVWVREGGRGYWGLLNLGIRPTFTPGRKKAVAEVHLLDFKGKLYGRELEVFLLRKRRDERAFATSQELARQIKKDERVLRRWVARREIVPLPSRALRTQKGPPG